MYYFKNIHVNIIENENLREPQKNAYRAAYEHFVIKKSTEHAIITLPTGTGKTGLIAIAPYGISNGRVLIITPQTIIRDSIIGSLDPEDPKNFWMFSNVINCRKNLPSLIEYDKMLPMEVLENANIIVLNIHKLQERLDSSLIKKVPSDFFDMIIIDEAHHSEAKTWKNTLKYFNKSKVLKVTGTPFRSDGKNIEGTEIYNYSLAQAMANGYIKSLEKFDYIPEQMFFTIDNNENKKYTLEELRNNNIKEEDWITRSVALSEESNEKIIDLSIKHLEEKKLKTNNPHKIIAVACSISHAEKIKEKYQKKGYKCSIIHSNLDKLNREKELNKISAHEVDVVVNVAMLGEGYDHKFLSIAAIFRPFKALLPYAQFIGRTLRIIDSKECNVVLEDNLALVISHKELGLEPLWEYYKKENFKRDIINDLKNDFNLEDFDEYTLTNDKIHSNKSIGQVYESTNYSIQKDTFIETSLFKEREKRLKEEQQKIEQLIKMLGISEDKARDIIRQTTSDNSDKLLRPDKFYLNKRKDLDILIKENLIPDLLAKYNLKTHNCELKSIKFLPKNYTWIYSKCKNNGCILGLYFNSYLKYELNCDRDNLTFEQYDKAFQLCETLYNYICDTLNEKMIKE